MDIEFREQLVVRHREIYDFLFEADFKTQTDELIAQKSREYKKLAAITKKYCSLLPLLPVSRCPICGEVQQITIDNVNIDGPWWSMDEPARPPVSDRLCPHWLAQTGAVSVVGEPPLAPFIVRPGPAVPYVVRPILERSEVCAVLSSFPVGPHRAFLVMYFSHQPNFNTPLHDVWPTDIRPPGLGKASRAASDSILDYYDESSYDYDPKPWMNSNKLFWIMPDDLYCKIFSGADGAPYFGIPGEKRIQILLDGELTTD
jgi:hypothetical protein